MKKNELLIGWGNVDITPYGCQVNLYGQFKMRVTSTVRDPVTATALVLANANDKSDCVIFVSADTCVIPGNVLGDLRARLCRDAPAVPVDKLILNSTHTHTAPAMKSDWHPNLPEGTMTPPEYIEFFVEKVATAVVDAWSNASAGKVAWGFGRAVVGHNRRTVYTEDISKRGTSSSGRWVDGFGKMYGLTNDPAFSHMEGSEDHSINLLYAWDDSQKLTGAIVNIPCPAQETGGDREISADFWHEIRREIRLRHGDSLFILPQDSAAGGMTSRAMIEREAEQRMLQLKGISMRDEIGHRVANAFDEILDTATKDIRDQVEFRHLIDKVELPMRPITDEEYQQVKAEYDSLKDDPARTAEAGRCARVLARHERMKTKPTFPFEIHALRLGDISFATNSFELFTDFGLQIKARAPSLQTLLIQHCGSEEHLVAGTYLATATAEKNKGYSATIYCNIIGHQGGDVLVEKTLQMINQLWSDNHE